MLFKQFTILLVLCKSVVGDGFKQPLQHPKHALIRRTTGRHAAVNLDSLRGLVDGLRGGGLDAAFTATKEAVAGMGPAAPIGLSAVYILCELLSLPAVPLAVFSGALYGVLGGTFLVLSCGVLSTAIMFYVGRMYREKIVQWLSSRPGLEDKFNALDRIIFKGGSRAIFLLRIAPNPIPFMNYLYGITSIKPAEYILGTALGFLPGTIIIVYSGAAGREILSGGLQQPWYVYAAAAAAFTILGKVAADTLDRLKQED